MATIWFQARHYPSRSRVPALRKLLCKALSFFDYRVGVKLHAGKVELQELLDGFHPLKPLKSVAASPASANRRHLAGIYEILPLCATTCHPILHHGHSFGESTSRASKQFR